MEQHPLDHPIWAALTTRQASFAEVCGSARRFPPAVTTLSAIAAPSADAWASFGELVGPERPGGMFLAAGTPIPDALQAAGGFEIVQMIEEADGERSPASPIALGPQDADEVVALARLTRPGPFDVRTIELGTFLGVRVEGRLAAMAGQRMHVPGFREISAVCTHPDHTGRGYAALLTGELARRIRAAGEVPFLHVRSENERAIALYRRLGFRVRRRFDYVVMRPR